MKRRFMGLLLSCAIIVPQSVIWVNASEPALDITWLELPSYGTWKIHESGITDGPVCFIHNREQDNSLEMSQYYDLSGRPVETTFDQNTADFAFSCGLGMIERDGKYGYIDAEGNLVIDCIYDNAYTFAEGLAVVEKDGKDLLIDASGKTFLNLSEHQLAAYGFSEGLCAVSSKADESWGLTGYIDKNGELVVPMRYMSVFDFRNGIVVVQEYYDGKGCTGAVDENGNIIIPCEYDVVEDYSFDGKYIIAKDETRSDIYRRDGTLLQSFPKSQYDSVRADETDDLIFVGNHRVYGCLDMDGHEVIPMIYTALFESGIDGVLMAKLPLYRSPTGTTVWGTITLDDKMEFVPWPDGVIYEKYDFSEGVTVAEQQSTGKYGYVDQSGVWVIPPQFDRAEPFENGYALVSQNGRIGILKNPFDHPSPWAADDVSMARELGLLPRQVDSCYTTAITRQHFSELMVRLVETADGKKIDARSVLPFTDTADIAVRKAYAAGIVTGTGDGTTFLPDASITREQMATMLYRAIQYIQEQTGRSVLTEAGGLDGFTDAGQVSGWAADSLAALTASGILQGTSSATLSPKDTTTVEQAILLTLRAYQEFS